MILMALAGLTPTAMAAEQSYAQRLLARPAPAGLSLILQVLRSDEENNATLRLDGRRETADVRVRIDVLDGPEVNRRVLLVLRSRERDNEYYVHDPVLGLEVLTRSRIEKQFRNAGLELRALLDLLGPRTKTPTGWSDAPMTEGVVVLGPPRHDGCRDRYHLPPDRPTLPSAIDLCARGGKTRRLEFEGSFRHAGVLLPKRIRYRDEWGNPAEIVLSPADTPRWSEAGRFTSEALAQP